MLPLQPGGPSPLAPQDRDWDILLTAETHNFPCAVAPYPGEQRGGTVMADESLDGLLPEAPGAGQQRPGACVTIISMHCLVQRGAPSAIRIWAAVGPSGGPVTAAFASLARSERRPATCAAAL